MSSRARQRIFPAVVLAAALALIGIGLPAGAASAADRSPWDAIAQCESGGDWSIDTGNGYSGGLQFSRATWAAHGGRGSAANASRAEQIRIGRRVVASQGWEAWAGCSARLGLHGRHAEPRATGIPTCTAKALRVRYADDGAIAGVRYVDLVLVNTGAHRCRLAGAARTTRLTADQNDWRITAAAAAPARRAAVAARKPHLVLSAHGGRARSRIMVEGATGPGERCRPAAIRLRRGGLDTGDPSLDGLRLQTCADTRHRVITLGHPA